jgi:hypothetical protein
MIVSGGVPKIPNGPGYTSVAMRMASLAKVLIYM